VAPFLDARGLLRTWPHRDDADGFIAALLRRHA
jgi:16S rRNA C967 or C1407 C5-methylase (RsmB/RsmF family)